jgi:uncharacterized heparinase superfamily protein
MSTAGDGLLSRLDAVAAGLARPDRAPRKGNTRQWSEQLWSLVYGNPIYPLTLVGPAPDRLAAKPPDPWPGDSKRGDHLFQGRYRFAGQEVTAPKMPVWLPAGVSDAWIEEMHGFEWLRHFKASGGSTARRHARSLVRDWIRQCGHWRPIAWRADVLGRRLAAWTTNAGFLLSDAEDAWREAFLTNLAMQARHLTRSLTRETDGAARISAARGLLYCGLCLGPSERRVNAAVRHLIRECKRQVLADGGHVSRSPSVQRRLLGDLADSRALLVAANRVPPEELTRTIDRMAPMLRAMCHGDGALAAFNDSGEDDARIVDTTLKLADVKASPLANAPHSGYQRLSAGASVVIFDTGAPDAGSVNAHAGTLAFEMSVGDNRLIVNCGPHGSRDVEWSRALRSTAAHSTMVVADTSSSEVGPDNLIRQRPRDIGCDRQDSDGATWVDANHDGYAENFGLVHRRRLYLSADGCDLRGEDILSPAPGMPVPGPQPFAVRFHLHPRVQASLVMHGQAALFKMPDGSGWQLRAIGGSLALNPSVYFMTDGERRRSEQAVLVGVCGPEGATLKWAIRKISS